MAIQFIAVKCPECNADLSIEEGRKFAFCTYCGTKVMINNENEHIYRTIDEAGIKQAETERIIRLKELEMEEKSVTKGRIPTYVAYGIALIFVTAGVLNLSSSGLSGMWAIIIGAYIALFASIGGRNKQKKNRQSQVGTGNVRISAQMVDCEHMNYHNVVTIFTGAGFRNVTAIPMNDLNIFTMSKNGQVDQVTIDGEIEFEEGDIYPKDAAVLITYHGK